MSRSGGFVAVGVVAGLLLGDGLGSSAAQGAAAQGAAAQGAAGPGAAGPGAGGQAAADKGSAQSARAMLERAVAAVKADESKALAAFNAGASGFRDHDLYVFCARLDGEVDAHVDPAQIGRNIKDLYDVDGVAFGQEMMAIAREGEIKVVRYMWPEPASHTPVDKVTFFTRVADQVCGVGYYK